MAAAVNTPRKQPQSQPAGSEPVDTAPTNSLIQASSTPVINVENGIDCNCELA